MIKVTVFFIYLFNVKILASFSGGVILQFQFLYFLVISGKVLRFLLTQGSIAILVSHEKWSFHSVLVRFFLLK